MEIAYHLIQTFTCRYDAREDRLLLTLNYQDIEKRVDFWITRSFLMKLIPIFFDYTVQESQSTQPSFSKDEQLPTDTTTYLLMQQLPLMLESIDFQPMKYGTRVVLKNLEKSLFYEAKLDQNLMKNFVNLILKSVPKYEWGIYNI